MYGLELMRLLLQASQVLPSFAIRYLEDYTLQSEDEEGWQECSHEHRPVPSPILWTSIQEGINWDTPSAATPPLPLWVNLLPNSVLGIQLSACSFHNHRQSLQTMTPSALSNAAHFGGTITLKQGANRARVPGSLLHNSSVATWILQAFSSTSVFLSINGDNDSTDLRQLCASSRDNK